MKNVCSIKVWFLVSLLLTLAIGTYSGTGICKDADQIRVNVFFKTWVSVQNIEDVASQYAIEKIVEIKKIKMATYQVKSGMYEKVRKALLSTGVVSFVERDVLYSIPSGETKFSASAIPNDPNYPNQWGPQCIGAEQAWDYSALQGTTEVIVAVVDTGIDLDHPDLAGQVDTSIDYDFVNNDSNAMDDNGHGTHCAGIIAATINNFVGVAGLQNVTLMAVKGLDRFGSGWTSDLADGVIYAADNGAKIISNSYGGYAWTNAMSQATLYAHSQGAIVIAAAGNDNTSSNHYPSAYPWVAGVGALENCTSRASYSNYGSNNVWISAPGSDIYSTFWNNTYAYSSGTSMACPHVAGVAAMWASANAGLTPTQILYLLVGTADDLGTPGRDNYYGFGRVDMFPWVD